MAEECPVCFHTVPQTQFQCGHRMCPRCTHQMLHHDGRCPLCRTTITSCDPPLVDCTGFPNTFYVELIRTTNDEKFGISIETDMTVKWAAKDNVAYMAGMRRKNIILEVNGLPCYENNVVATMLRQQGLFRICLHRKPDALRSPPSKGMRAWFRRLLTRPAHYASL